ncbi:trimethylamine methyltransferase family protein [Roseovarius sp. SCSIO 43702]|uniref:trimethylamine methyltransferase family protein n=1 Tax=Roseovarius sp. SCSIO 43702 TaxID=2823043 RepID=UPI001C72AF94|nr:trimethylamine methyltransferase family protein [Roseovarius sp. SCSIO 43702]QYX57926.1 trimethylamine methyltransferase family protein [Roseovarius sp. SCSIO 43702]
MVQSGARRKRGGGHAGNAERRGTATIEQMPWNPPLNIDRPTEPLDPEGVEAIHQGAMRILEEIGIEILNPEALEIFRNSTGCIIDGENLRMERDFVMEQIKLAPSEWTITPRNPDRAITIGGRHLNFGNVSSPPSYWDMSLGKKVTGTREMCANLLKLSQYFNCIHFTGGYPVEPQDIHPGIRHLDVLYDKLTLTDKVTHAYCLGRERVEDVMEMVRIAGGHSHEEFEEGPKLFANINSTSPLKHDLPMLDGWMRMARRNQALIVTPFTLAGAMAPVTMAGAVAQSIAEALVAVVLAQLVRPGAPVAIGTFTSNVDMKSGAPAFGTPEYMRATQMTGQLARFYGLPMRASGVCAANVPDAQATWETSNSLWSAVQAGAHMVYHAAGWLEGGLIASPEKLVMDCEILQHIQRYMDPALTATGPDEIAIDAIREVGDKGHFFGIQHTQDRYTTAFYQPFLSDWRNFEAWEAAGGVWTAQRAHQMFRDIIASFEAPPMDEARHEELLAFVARRKAEGGAPTDF